MILAALLFIASILFSHFEATKWNSNKDRDYDKNTSIYAGFGFGVMVIFLGLYGYKTYRVLISIALSDKKQHKVRQFMIVISIYFIIFVSRTIWDILNALALNPLQNLLNIWHTNNTTLYYWSYLIFYAIAEVVPTSAVIFVLQFLLPTNPSKRSVTEHNTLINQSSHGLPEDV